MWGDRLAFSFNIQGYFRDFLKTISLLSIFTLLSGTTGPKHNFLKEKVEKNKIEAAGMIDSSTFLSPKLNYIWKFCGGGIDRLQLMYLIQCPFIIIILYEY